MLILSVFIADLVIFSTVWKSKASFIEHHTGVTFVQLLETFDAESLCPFCKVIRLPQSRHCNICNKCVDRYDHHCPWVNNCVGIDNHGVFMSFLLSMLTLLSTTFITLIMNFDCFDNLALPRDDKFFYPDLFLPDFFYERGYVETVTIICLVICGTFLMLVL